MRLSTKVKNTKKKKPIEQNTATLKNSNPNESSHKPSPKTIKAYNAIMNGKRYFVIFFKTFYPKLLISIPPKAHVPFMYNVF